MAEITFTIKGLTKAIQHNGRLANPLDPLVRSIREITSKSKKTETDTVELYRLEFLGSLYSERLDKDNRFPTGSVVWPDVNIDSMFVAAAKLEKKGKAATAGLRCRGNPELIYPSIEKDCTKLWDRTEHRCIVGVKVNRARVFRSRAAFPQWKLTFTMVYDEALLNRDTVIRLCETAGREVGLSDWRPRYGQFTIESVHK